MPTRIVYVAMTHAEARALEICAGNIIDEGDAKDAVGSASGERSAVRALDKLRAAIKLETNPLDQAMELLSRYVSRLPPCKEGSTDGDTQRFLRDLGVDPDVVAGLFHERRGGEF